MENNRQSGLGLDCVFFHVFAKMNTTDLLNPVFVDPYRTHAVPIVVTFNDVPCVVCTAAEVEHCSSLARSFSPRSLVCLRKMHKRKLDPAGGLSISLFLLVGHGEPRARLRHQRLRAKERTLWSLLSLHDSKEGGPFASGKYILL